METTTAILLTQIPITLAILIGVYEIYLTKKELIKLLARLTHAEALRKKQHASKTEKK